MRISLCLCVTCLATTPLPAVGQTPYVAVEWKRVGGDRNSSFYVHLNTIKIQQHHRQVWFLDDWKGTNEAGTKSVLRLIEVDCKRSKSRELKTVIFSGQLGSGEVLSSHGMREDRWDTLRAGWGEKLAAELACSKIEKRIGFSPETLETWPYSALIQSARLTV